MVSGHRGKLTRIAVNIGTNDLQQFLEALQRHVAAVASKPPQGVLLCVGPIPEKVYEGVQVEVWHDVVGVVLILILQKKTRSIYKAYKVSEVLLLLLLLLLISQVVPRWWPPEHV